MERKIKNILSLPAYEHFYRNIIYFNEEKSFLIFKLYDKELLLSIDIRVQAGVDLQKGFSVKNLAPNNAEIILPKAEILLVDAEEESINELFITEYGKKIDRLDYYTEIDKAKIEIVRDAIANGILQNAEQNISVMLGSLFKSVGYENVDVVFKDNIGEDYQID